MRWILAGLKSVGTAIGPFRLHNVLNSRNRRSDDLFPPEHRPDGGKKEEKYERKTGYSLPHLRR